jgi:arginyl-tRNA synthetase
LKEYIKQILQKALSVSGYPDLPIIIERPKDEKFGDYSSNIAMVIAKKEKKNPRELASKIIAELNLPDNNIEKAEIAGAGFINFFISDKFYLDGINEILKHRSDFGKLKINDGRTANIEWVSANPTGPLHAGHGRHIALGKAVGNLLEWSGYNLTREYYFNNAGKQMDNLAESVYSRYMQKHQPDYPFPDNGYIGDYIGEIADFINGEYGAKLVNTRDMTLFKTAGENWCFKLIRHTLDRLGIQHDIFYNEDSLYKSGKITKILEEFKKRGFSYEKDGATWLKTSELLKDKKDAEDKVIVKSSGEPTYRLPDMAYHIDKLERGFDSIVDVFGADHSDTYKEVMAGVGALGYDVSKIKVIIHQMVTFVQDGKPVKMSKRSDNVYYLDELLDDVGVDVAQFFFVMRSANTHLDFDVKLATEQSEKNPVFYLQYAHARICGILRNAEQVFPGFHKIELKDMSLLKEADEIKLGKKLSAFPETVESAYLTLEPHKIITYLNELAEAFHIFYHNHRVITADEREISIARLKLCEAARIVLQNGFYIIGISAPERM